MSRKSWPSLTVLLPIMAGTIVFILHAAIGGALVDSIVEQLLRDLGLERAPVIAAASPYVIPVAIAALCLYAAYRIGVYERISFEPTPDLDSRKAFEVVLNDKKWLRKNTETDQLKLQRMAANYLKIRLDGQFHDALAQGKLWAWGEQSLVSGVGPRDRLPPEKWHEIEIVFEKPSEARAYARKRSTGQLAYVGIRLCSDQVAKQFNINRRTLRISGSS